MLNANFCFHCSLYQGGSEMGGIYVKSLLPGGAAEACGKLVLGMLYFTENGVKVHFHSTAQPDLKLFAQKSLNF